MRNISISEWEQRDRYEYTVQEAANVDELRDTLSLDAAGWKLIFVLYQAKGWVLIFERAIEEGESDADVDN